MGENLRPWILLMFLALLGVMVVAHLSRRRAADEQVPRDALRVTGIVCAVLSILFSTMAVYWVVRIGHSGSKAVWQPTQDKIDKGVREPRSESRSEHGG
jgi:drug/metabolite transporter (DMT)-like permease